MDTVKLQEALADLNQQRSVLDEAIASLQKAIALMSNGRRREAASKSDSAAPPPMLHGTAHRRKSFIDETVEILTQHGKPLHVNDIVDEISRNRGADVKRGSVESTIAQHIKRLGERSRLYRPEPSTYGLPSWRPRPIEVQVSENLSPSD